MFFSKLEKGRINVKIRLDFQLSLYILEKNEVRGNIFKDEKYWGCVLQIEN